jgi:hypothetical protein
MCSDDGAGCVVKLQAALIDWKKSGYEIVEK